MANKIKTWQPLPNGNHYQAAKDTRIDIRADMVILDNKYAILTAVLKDNFRFCELVESETHPVPDEIKKAITHLADYGIPLGCTNADWNLWRDTVTRWLSTLETEKPGE